MKWFTEEVNGDDPMTGAHGAHAVDDVAEIRRTGETRRTAEAGAGAAKEAEVKDVQDLKNEVVGDPEAKTLRKVSMNVSNEDLQRASVLGEALVSNVGRPSNRTEVFRRAVHLLYWAFITKGATELIAKKDGKEVGRLRWADSPVR